MATVAAMIVVGAAWMVVHTALLIRAVLARQLPVALRWLALVPPATPLLAWRVRARAGVVMWCALALGYGGLWLW